MNWQEHINSLRVATKEMTESEAAALVEHALPVAITKSLSTVPRTKTGDVSPIGVLFSGGVDSTLLCFLLQKMNVEFVALTVGFRDSEEQKLPDDIFHARQIAKAYNFTHREKMYSAKEMQDLFEETIRILGEDYANAVNVGVGSVELAALNLAPEVNYFMGGLGSEEVFAGYKRHSDSQNIQEECWSGLLNMYDRDLVRDTKIASAKNITWLTPFLDDDFIQSMMTIPDTYKIKDGVSKYILRVAAKNLGLKEEFAFRPKQAAQYGSRTDSALDKLAKKAGFDYKREYIASFFN